MHGAGGGDDAVREETPVTPAAIARDVADIRARVQDDRVAGSVPINRPWEPTPPFEGAPNLDANRGHTEHRGRAGIDCTACKSVKPRGGWAAECVRSGPRDFRGG